MPVYEFLNPKTNEVKEYFLPLRLRNKEIYEGKTKMKRITAPSSLFISHNTPSPIDVKTSVMKGYRKLELEGKLQKRNGSFSANAIKKIWSKRQAIREAVKNG